MVARIIRKKRRLKKLADLYLGKKPKQIRGHGKANYAVRKEGNYLGVKYNIRRKRYLVRIQHKGKEIHFSAHILEIDAAKQYDKIIVGLFGIENVAVNFPEDYI